MEIKDENSKLYGVLIAIVFMLVVGWAYILFVGHRNDYLGIYLAGLGATFLSITLCTHLNEMLRKRKIEETEDCSEIEDEDKFHQEIEKDLDLLKGKMI